MTGKTPEVEPLAPYDLEACARALRKPDPSLSLDELQFLIDEGHRHLKILEAAQEYEGQDDRVSSLKVRLRRAQRLLDEKHAAA